MSKKDKSRIEELEMLLKLERSLRLTEDVAIDVKAPTKRNQMTLGYSHTPGHAYVIKSWSLKDCSGQGEPPKKGEPLVQAVPWSTALYSTELLALQALRHKESMSAAQRLAEIDDWIADVKLGRKPKLRAYDEAMQKALTKNAKR